MERPRHRARTLLADIGVGNGCYGILRAIAFHFAQTAAQRPATKSRTDLRRHARTRITNKKIEEVRSPSGNQKHRTSLRKSSDVLPQKYGGLPQRSPMFSVSEAYTSSRKKVLCFSPTFLHQFMEIRLYIGDFGCRKGCRMLPGCRTYPAFPQRIWDFLNKLIHVSQVESENKRMRPRHAPKGQRAHSPGQPSEEEEDEVIALGIMKR